MDMPQLQPSEESPPKQAWAARLLKSTSVSAWLIIIALLNLGFALAVVQMDSFFLPGSSQTNVRSGNFGISARWVRELFGFGTPFHTAAPYEPSEQQQERQAIIDQLQSRVPRVRIDLEGLKHDDALRRAFIDSAGRASAARVERMVDNKVKQFVIVSGAAGQLYDAVGQPVLAPDGSEASYLATVGDMVEVVRSDGESEAIGTLEEVQAAFPNAKPDVPLDQFFDEITPEVLGYTSDGQRITRGFRSGAQFVMVGEQPTETFDETSPPVISIDGRQVAYVGTKVLNASTVYDRAHPSCLRSSGCREQLKQIVTGSPRHEAPISQVVLPSGVSAPYSAVRDLVPGIRPEQFSFIGERLGQEFAVVGGQEYGPFDQVAAVAPSAIGQPAVVAQLNKAWGVYQGSELQSALPQAVSEVASLNPAAETLVYQTPAGQLLKTTLSSTQPPQEIAGLVRGYNRQLDELLLQRTESDGTAQLLTHHVGSGIERLVADRLPAEAQSELIAFTDQRTVAGVLNSKAGKQVFSQLGLSPAYDAVTTPQVSPDGKTITYAGWKDNLSQVVVDDAVVAQFDRLLSEPTFTNQNTLAVAGTQAGIPETLNFPLQPYKQASEALGLDTAPLQLLDGTTVEVLGNCGAQTPFTVLGRQQAPSDICAVKIMNGEIEYLELQLPYLRNIRRLDLSNNNFRQLPPYLTELKHLEWIDISGNQIENLSLLKTLPNLKEVEM